MKNRIKELREQKNLNQVGLAAIVGCSQNVISRYELGKSHPTDDVLVSMAKHFHVSIDYLLCQTDCQYKADFYASQPSPQAMLLLEKYHSLSPDTKAAIGCLLNHLS